MPKDTILTALLSTRDISAYFKANPLLPSKAQASFPIVQGTSDTWKTVANASLDQNVAADFISTSSTVPVSGRPSYESVMGEFASFGKGREWTAKKIKQFEKLKKEFATYKNQQAAVELINYYGADLDFIRRSMYVQMADICWTVTSSACDYSFLKANSPYLQGLTAMSYPVEAWQKNNVTTSWANPAALILDDIESVVIDVAKAQNKQFLVLHINRTWFGYMRKNTQIQQYAATLIQSITSTQAPPTEEQINDLFSNYFQLPVRLNIIDEETTREAVNGVRTTTNPFRDGVAVFSQSIMLGRFEWEQEPIIDATKETYEDFFLVGTKKSVDPSYSKMYAKGNAFVAVDSYDQNFYLKIDGVAW